MVFMDWWRDCHCSESGDTGRSGAVRGGAFEERNILSVDSKSAGSDGGSDRAVVKVVVSQDALEVGLRGATEHTV